MSIKLVLLLSVDFRKSVHFNWYIGYLIVLDRQHMSRILQMEQLVPFWFRKVCSEMQILMILYA